MNQEQQQRGVVSDGEGAHNDEEHGDNDNAVDRAENDDNNLPPVQQPQQPQQHPPLDRQGMNHDQREVSLEGYPSHYYASVPYPYPYPPPSPPHPLPPPPGQQILQFYEAQMRDHAAAYASAAAGAAWVAAQIAADMANASSVMAPAGVFPPPPMVPRSLPIPPTFPYGHPQAQPGLHPYDHMNAGYPGTHTLPCLPLSDGGGGGGVMPFLPGAEGTYMPHPSGDATGTASSDHYGQQKRRKRQQQLSPSNVRPYHPHHGQDQPWRWEDGTEKRGRRRRFHTESGGGGCSDHGGSDHSSYSGHANNSNSKRRARIRKSMTSSNSSDGGNSAIVNKNKKARKPNVDSLLGKTGISAIYEWCDKRRMTTPTFTLVHSETIKSGNVDAPSDDEKRTPSEFEMSVTIDGIEWGRGRARTKTAARQEAARRALQALIPGTVFDDTTGILIELPADGDEDGDSPSRMIEPNAPSSALWKASTSLEDLAPNLAKRLAIASKDDCKPAAAQPMESSKKRPPKWHGVYPSTTTSEEEDENAYYASRGASVCSALLHAMVQIDDRIPEGPNYAFEVPSKGDTSDSATQKRLVGTELESLTRRSPILVHRGPFTCTASMRLQQTMKVGETEPRYELLKAVSVGGAKREAKHMASAKLLALLFPECNGMAQVKEAAEAARERYAASKALKQEETKRERRKTIRWTQLEEASPSNTLFAMGSAVEPKLPQHVENHLRGIIVDSEHTDEDSSNQARQRSRQKQWDTRISAALQKFNEHDDEGRSLPEEDLLTVDDVVGRTILRRATVEDFKWIAKLLDDAGPPTSPVCTLGYLGEISDEPSDDFGSTATSLWSASSITLLLCRAIAPYDDPPLGCAVLTLGFSMDKGRTLFVSQIGSRPHLPRERFMECLQAFAFCMNCTLESERAEATASSDVRIGPADIQQIIRSHLSDQGDESARNVTNNPERSSSPQRRPQKESFVQVASSLQSVQEESEGVEESGPESGTEKRVGRKKGQDKPSKRSRVH